ncbi:MAG: hypothetical protein WCB85_04955 [Candidatus Dormiibacterota bacterium]
MSAEQSFRLVADISSDAPQAVRPLLDERFPGAVTSTDDGFHVEATVAGQSARDLNRDLLTALRQRERRTRLRSEWTSSGTAERFFDYVPKGRRTAS